jgi:hypothetical protein
LRRSSFGFFALAAFAYSVLTAALTWPLALHPRSLVPSDIGDPLLNTWILWWNTQAVPLTDAWWNAPQFAPIEGTLAFSEHLLGLTPITSPIIWLTGDPLLAYNAAFFLAFPLSAIGAHFLVYSITRRHDLGVIAGLIYAFAPYRLPQIAHVQVLSAYWMPVALAALHRFLDFRLKAEATLPAEAGSHKFGVVASAFRRKSGAWLFLFAAAWLLQALACGYYFIFLSVLIVFWLAWFARSVRTVLPILGAWAIAAACLAPVLYGYWWASRTYGLGRTLIEIRAFSADIASLFKAGEVSLTWGWLRAVQRPESDLFPGATVLLLAVAGLIVAWRLAARESTGHPRAARALLAIAALAGGLGIARMLWGPFKLEIAGLRLLSVTAPEKPVTVAVLSLAAAALLHPAVRTAWRRRSPLAFYLLAAVAMWLFALGPAPTLLDKPALYKAPYAWLMMVPGVDGVRVPARFWMLALLCLSVAAALAVRLLAQRWPRTAAALPAIVIAGVLIDGLPRPLPMAARPAERPNHAAADLRLDLPIGPDFDTIALYRAAGHGRPLINGYSGYFAPHYWALRQLLAGGHTGAIEQLAQYGSIEVMVDHELDADGSAQRLASAMPGARRVYESATYSSYLVPRAGGPPAALSGSRLAFSVTDVSVNPGFVHEMQDGDLGTRWHGGREQRRGDTLTVDVGTERELTGVELLLGGYLSDWPRYLEIETSADGVTWSPAWRGDGAPAALAGGLSRPREMPLAIPLNTRARYIRFTQTGTELVNYWTIAEMRVLGR